MSDAWRAQTGLGRLLNLGPLCWLDHPSASTGGPQTKVNILLHGPPQRDHGVSRLRLHAQNAVTYNVPTIWTFIPCPLPSVAPYKDYSQTYIVTTHTLLSPPPVFILSMFRPLLTITSHDTGKWSQRIKICKSETRIDGKSCSLRESFILLALRRFHSCPGGPFDDPCLCLFKKALPYGIHVTKRRRSYRISAYPHTSSEGGPASLLKITRARRHTSRLRNIVYPTIHSRPYTTAHMPFTWSSPGPPEIPGGYALI